MVSALPHIQRILDRLQGVRATATGWEALCPAHEDRNPSLSIGIGKDDRALVNCQAKCPSHTVLRKIDMTFKDLFRDGAGEEKSKVIATYDYVDEQGQPLFQVCRLQPKSFRQRVSDGKGGWSWSVNGVRRVLYRLPDLLAADPDQTVYIVEGEKDADNLRDVGLIATCGAGGAGAGWRPEYSESLAGRDVVIIADKDTAGRKLAAQIKQSLIGKARSVRIVEVPGKAKDASDFLAAGGTADQLASLPDAPEDATPAPASPTTPTVGRWQLGENDPDTGRPVLSPKQTPPSARRVLREFFNHPDGLTLVTYAGVPHEWLGNRFVPIEPTSIHQKLYPFLESAVRPVLNRATKEIELQQFESNHQTVDSVYKALVTTTHLPQRLSVPCWRDPRPSDLPADELLPCATESIHLPTLQTVPATPRLFTTSSLDFNYQPDAPDPERWFRFLHEAFPNDPDSLLLLQQFFGYCLTPDTRQQKIMLLIGPKRSGKGTISRVLQAMIGAGNCASPTVGSLAGSFGLQPLIGKSVAIIADARFSGDGISQVVERLLCISGEDSLTIDRKFLGSVTMKLPTRFVILTNELPRLPDSSGALAGRFLILRFTQSFYGRENINLADELTAELPGILQWSIQGWHLLRSSGRFIMPASSVETADDLEETSSSVLGFVRDCCVVGPDERVWVDEIFEAWKTWCSKEGFDRPGTKNSLGQKLRAAIPGMTRHRGTDNTRFYVGVALK